MDYSSWVGKRCIAMGMWKGTITKATYEPPGVMEDGAQWGGGWSFTVLCDARDGLGNRIMRYPFPEEIELLE